MIRSLVIIFIILISSFLPTSAKSQVFAGYDDFCGLPVIVAPDAQQASARRDSHGQAFIHVDPTVMNNWTSSRIFTLAHECAHHLLGHTSALGHAQRYNGGTKNQELEADCWASRVLAKNNFINDISRTVVERASQGHFSAGGYPSGAERAQIIRQCVSTVERPKQICNVVNSPCNHPLHRSGDRFQCKHIVFAHPQGDRVSCPHACGHPNNPFPCHPSGHIYQCIHRVTLHEFDNVPCTHVSHPNGHKHQVCN